MGRIRILDCANALKSLNPFEIHFIHADWMIHVINNGRLSCLDHCCSASLCAVVIRDSIFFSKSPKITKNRQKMNGIYLTRALNI